LQDANQVWQALGQRDLGVSSLIGVGGTAGLDAEEHGKVELRSDAAIFLGREK